MGTVLEFGLLGPLEVARDGVRLALRGARQRVLLASLLVDANRVVTAGELIERLWESEPPPSARNALQTYVLRLRQLLTGNGEPAPVVTRHDGYLIEIDDDALDLHRFDSLAQRGKAASASGDHAQAAVLLDRALRLWRGEALQGVPSETLHRDVAPALEERRLLAVESRIDADLALGRHAEVVSELAELTARHRFREQLWAQRLTALYRCGRQADALDCYRTVQRLLAGELGIDPGPELQRLHQAVLTRDPRMMPPSRSAGQPAQEPTGAAEAPQPPPPPRQPPSAAATTGLPRLPPPRQLPPPPRRFTGRSRELAVLTAELDGGADGRADAGATVVISAIGGAGGIGKTWLALHWAHLNMDRFPGGQLYVNLRGFDPAADPMPPGEAVRGFLAALGVGQDAVPVDLDAATALYRSLTAGKRMLIVLDNARDTAQVVPLLPGSPSCTVLVTSRHKLSGLVTAYGAVPVNLDVLDETSARALLASHLGRARIEAEPRAAADLLRYCAGLPLALSITAARAATHPGLPLPALAEELRSASARLDALDAGELTASLRAVFSSSRSALRPQVATVFALLGLAPGPDISLPAAAALTAVPAGRLRGFLSELIATSLVQEHCPGRYRMHDLVRLYAAEQARLQNPQSATTAALRRLTDFYLHTAYSGQRLLYALPEPMEVAPPAAGSAPHRLRDAQAAMAWFDREHACLLAAQHLAADRGWDTAVWQLAWVMSAFQQSRGLLHDHLAAWRAGFAATRRLGDPALQAHAHRFLGSVLSALGRHAQALSHVENAVSLAGQAEDLAAQAHAQHALGRAWEYRGDIHRALHHETRALHLFQAIGDAGQQARELNNVGWLRAQLGRYQQARADCERALALSREHRDHVTESSALDSLGFIAQHTGEHQQALDYYRRALSLRKELGSTYDQAGTLDGVGHTYLSLGQSAQARSAWQQALDLYQAQHRTGDASRIEQQLNSLSRHSRAAGSSPMPSR